MPSFSMVVVIADSGVFFVLSIVVSWAFLSLGNIFDAFGEIAFTSFLVFFFGLTGSSLFLETVSALESSEFLSAGSFMIIHIKKQQMNPVRIKIPGLPPFLRRLTLRSFFLRTLGIACPQ